MESNERIRCLIIGSGPAGYTAAIYAARANLSPVLYEGIQPGGQLTTTTDIENFPGYPEGISGSEMMEQLRQQAARFGTEIRTGIVTASDFAQAPYRLTIDGEKIVEADAVIIATGASAKYLGLPDETKYAGQGGIGLCHLRRIFLPKKSRRRRRWWRHSLRRSRVPVTSGQQSVHDCAQELPASFENHAGKSHGQPQHRSSFRDTDRWSLR